MGFLQLALHQLSPGDIDIQPFITDHTPVLIITDVTGEQDGNRAAVFAFKFDFVINYPAVAFDHFFEFLAFLRLDIQLVGDINVQKFIFITIPQHIQKCVVGI